MFLSSQRERERRERGRERREREKEERENKSFTWHELSTTYTIMLIVVSMNF